MAGEQISAFIEELLVATYKDETPRQGGGSAVDLGIEHVAQTDKGAHETHRDDDAVKYPEIGDVGLFVFFLIGLSVETAYIKP